MDERYNGPEESWLEGEHLAETGASFHREHSSICFVSGHHGCKEVRPYKNFRKRKKRKKERERRYVLVL